MIIVYIGLNVHMKIVYLLRWLIVKRHKIDTLKVKISDDTGTLIKIKDDNIERIKKKFNMFLKEKYS